MPRPALPLLAALVLFSCARGAEEARRQLQERGLPFTEATFLAQVESGETALVELFLRAGISPDAADHQGHTALMLAARRGHAGVAQALARAGASLQRRTRRQVNKVVIPFWIEYTRQEPDATALHMAAREGHAEVVRVLAAAGADIEARDRDGDTALIEAAFAAHTEAALALVAAGADVTARNSSGTTVARAAAVGATTRPVEGRRTLEALEAAGARDADAALVDRLRRQGAGMGLAQAAAAGDVEQVRAWLREGADREGRFSHSNDTPLLVAVQRGHRAVVLVLLEADADVNAANNGGLTPLMAAVQRGDVEVARLLLGSGAAVDARDGWGRTALMMAAAQGSAGAVRLLLERGAAVGLLDRRRMSALALAVDAGQAEAAALLRAAGAPEAPVLGVQLLHAAVRDEGERVGTLLAAGADPAVENGEGHTALVAAARRGARRAVAALLGSPAARGQAGQALVEAARAGHAEVLRLLLGAGTAVDSRDANGLTPLHWAAGQGRGEAVRLLLAAGADVNARMQDTGFRYPMLPRATGWTPVMWAAGQGHEAIVRRLLDAGADASVPDSRGNTALSWATMGNHAGVVALLQGGTAVPAGAPRPADPAAGQALMDALVFKKREIALQLLERGADPNTPGRNGTTPLSIAVHYGDLELTEALLRAGADVNAQRPPLRQSALMHAAEGGHVAIVRRLIEAGADVNARDEGGQDVLGYARVRGNPEVLRSLEQAGAKRTGWRRRLPF